MCGIAGALDLTAGIPEDDLIAMGRRMAARLVHRGPDDEGVWTDPSAGVVLAHRRLSVIDLSREGAQPMQSRDGRYVLSYNGELYNHGEIRARLRVPFRGHSDTEVLAEAIAAWGVDDAIAATNGMFAFAVWDRQARRLSLGRDRLGEKPLYYTSLGARAVFASELGALGESSWITRTVDRSALSLLMRLGYVPAPYSIYEGVRKVEPGTCVHIDAGGVRSVRYWSLAQVATQGRRNVVAAADEAVIDELEALLDDAVSKRLMADVPLGALLSGGIDSATVVALMQRRSSAPVRTFTVGFDDPAFDESAAAAAISSYLGTQHTSVTLSAADALREVPHLADVFDEPFADSSQLPTLLVSRVARREVTVALSGDGGDEVFGGYSRYLLHGRLLKGTRVLPPAARRAAANLLGRLPPAAIDRAFDRLGPVLPRGLRLSRPGDKTQKFADLLRARTRDDIYRRLMSHHEDGFALVPGAVEPVTALLDPNHPVRFDDFLDQMMYLDTIGYLPDDILTKVDRASMSTSLEVRVPLLDHRVVEFAWRLPAGLRIADGQGKQALRRVASRLLPATVLSRPKMGFGVPIADWLRGPLEAWAGDLLSPAVLRAQGYLDEAVVSRLWEEHRSGTRDWKYVLWDVLMFQSWYERHATGIGAAA